MSDVELHIEFPCGYKFDFKGGAYSLGTSADKFVLCPLHGKDCPPKGKVS